MIQAVRSSGRYRTRLKLIGGTCCIIRVLTCALLTPLRKDDDLNSRKTLGSFLWSVMQLTRIRGDQQS